MRSGYLDLLVLALAVFLAATPSIVLSADSEPHLKTKLCNPAETACTDVRSDIDAYKRATVDSYITNTPISVTVSQDELSGLLNNNNVYSTTGLINASSSSSDNPIFLLKNPSGSGKKIQVLSISGNATISNERTLFRLFSNPTVTANGTAMTISSRNIGGGAAASSMQAYSLPTVSANGTNIINSQTGENSNELNIFLIDQSLLVQPNNTIMVTATPKSNNRVQTFTIVWAEVTP